MRKIFKVGIAFTLIVTIACSGAIVYSNKDKIHSIIIDYTQEEPEYISSSVVNLPVETSIVVEKETMAPAVKATVPETVKTVDKDLAELSIDMSQLPVTDENFKGYSREIKETTDANDKPSNTSISSKATISSNVTETTSSSKIGATGVVKEKETLSTQETVQTTLNGKSERTPSQATLSNGEVEGSISSHLTPDFSKQNTQPKIILVGDERVSDIKSDITVDDSEITFISRKGADLDWLKNVGVASVNNVIKDGDVIVISMGLYDYNRVEAEDYIEWVDLQLKGKWKGCKVLFTEVGYVSSDTERESGGFVSYVSDNSIKTIQSFNDDLSKEINTKETIVIPINTAIGLSAAGVGEETIWDDTTTGIYYSEDSNRKIIAEIKNFAKQYNSYIK